MASTKDEQIDGPLAAAKIIRQMDPDSQERVLEQIADIAPEIIMQLESKLDELENQVPAKTPLRERIEVISVPPMSTPDPAIIYSKKRGRIA